MSKRARPDLASVIAILAIIATPSAAPAQPAQQQPRLDVPYVPTPQETVDRMLSMAKVGANDFLIDLGSGDGRIVVTAAKQFGTRGFGVDIDPERIKESHASAKAAGVSNLVEFRNQDLFKTDISKATVLTMYLLPDINLRLRSRVLDELRPGTRVVSHAFTMGDWKPDAKSAGPGGRNEVFFWVVPAKVQGAWDARIALPDGSERTYRIDLTQSYQEITGLARSEGQTLPLVDTRLIGDRIEFTLIDKVGNQPFTARMAGRVDRDAMSGAVRSEASGAPAERRWNAKRAAP